MEKHRYSTDKPPSNNDCVVNAVKFKSTKREVESSVETNEDRTEEEKSYVQIFIHRESLYWVQEMVRRKDGKGPYPLIRNDNVCPNLCSG